MRTHTFGPDYKGYSLAVELKIKEESGDYWYEHNYYYENELLKQIKLGDSLFMQNEVLNHFDKHRAKLRDKKLLKLLNDKDMP